MVTTTKELPELEYLESVMKLMTKHKVSAVEVDGLKMVKEIHEDADITTTTTNTSTDEDEDLLFLSSN